MSDSAVRFGGRPTGPEVDLLVKAFPVGDMRAGVEIARADIARVIGIDVASSRFRTVTNSWRKRVYRDNNLWIIPFTNEAFIVTDGALRVSQSSRMAKSATSKIRRAGNLATRTPEDGLNDDEKRTRNAVIMMSGSMISIAQVERKKLSYKINSVSEVKKS